MKLTKINSIHNSLIKTQKGYPFPVYKTTNENSFIMGLVMGIKNSGKTNVVLNLLEHEKHLLQRGNKVWFISPTVDSKVKTFQEKYPDNFIVVDGLDIDTFRDTLDKIQTDIDEWHETNKIIQLLKRYLKKEKLTPLELDQLQEVDFLQNEDFSKMNLDYPNINTIIIDDSMGSPLISSNNSKQAKEFQRYAIRHRHLFTNLFILTQYPKGINKILRSNANLMVIFPMRDQSIYGAIFPEISGLFRGKLSNLLETMDEIEKRHNHSFLSTYYDKQTFVHINWDERVDFD